MKNKTQLTPSEYVNILKTYIKDKKSVKDFNDLYHDYFNKLPSQEMINDYINLTANTQEPNNETQKEIESYDESSY